MKDCPQLANCPYYQQEKVCQSAVGKIFNETYCHGARQPQCEILKLFQETRKMPTGEMSPDKNHNRFSSLFSEGMEDKISKCIAALKSNGFDVSYFDSREEALQFILPECESAESISNGGSMTLDELGLFRIFEEKKYPYFNYSTPANRPRSLTVDLYFTSSNAVTVDGELINIDGTGNRVAALCYGPKKVFVVVGTNKIVSNQQEGIDRILNLSAPLNAIRLKKHVPCTITGHCVDCNSPERICRNLVITSRPLPGRIHVVFVDEMLGF